MKSHRFFSFFFCLVLLIALQAPAMAASEDVGDWEVAAKAALLIDPDTEEILYARNIDERLYPASLTKIMTALLILEAIDEGRLALDQVLVASEEAIAAIPADGSNAGIKPGEELTVESLLYCIMLASANEGCNILAEGASGSVEAFVEEMNQRAAQLGCTDTHFTNTNGLPDTDHYTTAWDLYLITKAAREHEAFMPLVNTIYYEVPATNLSGPRELYTSNNLLSGYRTRGYLYQGAAGIKTGSTNAAGYCLISTAARSGRSLLCVVLGAERITLEDGTILTQSFSETIKLYDWGFDAFSREVILSTEDFIDEVPVTLSQEVNSVKVYPAQEVERLIPSDIDPETDIERTWSFTAESVEAPVQRGQVLGQITLSYGDTVYATVDLLADDDVAASRLLVFRRDLLLFIRRPIVKIVAIAVVALILMLIILRVTLRQRRRRYGRGYRPTGSGGYRGRRR